MVTERKNGLGRADIQAAGTAGFVGPGVGAQGLFQPEVDGFLELTNPLPGCQGNALQFPGFGGVGPEITVALLMAGKGRSATTEVDKHITFAASGGLHLAITQCTTAGGIQGLQLGKLHSEIAQCAIS